ncbi:molybdopterin-dependent oxidoreductase [Ramlibacter sp. Leaf400]|uniref:molybdopterin-dependent oxidoreductase n=1 Tax=Ramlibacter sp. Leaf400 TaxID=1736365 RepID=UPI0006FC7B5D|nr:molybdopterin-dependent oxidoreductase [Ramlibacter sp. Leaf400]KQT11356.1 molybdopterin-dependent oxidoreductase [Ramlibacter sp. Leaf400]
MKKRLFLGALAGGSASLPLAGLAQPAKAAAGPALLTVTGRIQKANRGPLDPVLDQMMAKQKLAFDKARTFDFGQLAGLPAVTIKPTLEYDQKQHALSGPLLATVLRACGATGSKLVMRAIDGYAPAIALADAQRQRFIVATHLDGRPMPLGGLGPLWAVYEADKFPDMAAKPVDQRFALCPWGLYHIDVQA